MQLSMVMREAESKETMNPSVREALSPKVDGTLNLDKLLPNDLDFFTMFSSITGIEGSPGLLPYAMCNVFQDEFARSRAERGFKATSIDLGITTNVGYMAENYGSSGLQKIGFLEVTEADIHALLAHLCDPSLPVAMPDRAQTVVGLETLAASQARGSAGGPCHQQSLFSCLNALRATRNTGQSGVDKTDISTNITTNLHTLKSHHEATAPVLDGLLTKIASILGIDQANSDTERPMHAFGLDSLVAIEVRNWFLRYVGADIAVFEILGNTSIADVAALAVNRSDFFKPAEEI